MFMRAWLKLRSFFGFSPSPGRNERILYSQRESHYKDCHDYGNGGFLNDTGCWCEHRGAGSHYGGGIKPGWHREDCPRVGIAWIVTWNSSGDNQWWQQPKCECQLLGTGKYVLTLQDGTIHGPPPSPMPGEEDGISISGDEINKILDSE
jgi:hypothetical protein